MAATTSQPGGVAAFTLEQVEAAHGYVEASRAASTRAKYLQHWTAFGAWCLDHGHRPLPADPAAVTVHLSSLAADGIAPQTLALQMAAIGYAHRQAGEAIPHKVRGGTVILDVLAGTRRNWGRPPDRKAAADGTSAARAGASVWKMQEQSRHESLSVLSSYVRSARLFEDHAGKDFA